MQTGGSVEAHVSHGVATVSLNRPQALNTLDESTRDGLRNVFGAIRVEPDVRAVVLTGGGDNFCAGTDLVALEDLTEGEAHARMQDVCDAALAIASCNKPVVAAIEGHVAGSGIGLALLCDVLIASKKARFSFSNARVGLAPDWGQSVTLPARIGAPASRRMLWGMAKLDASGALELGLIDDISLPGSAAEVALVQARTLADRPGLSVQATKKFFRVPLDELSMALENESETQTNCLMSDDFSEGMRAIRASRRTEISR